MSSTKKTRRHYTTEQKVAIFKRHLVDKIPVSDICNEEELQPSLFYQWQRQVFENLAGALATPAPATGPSKREKDRGPRARSAQGLAREEGRGHRRNLSGVRADKKALGEP